MQPHICNFSRLQQCIVLVEAFLSSSVMLQHIQIFLWFHWLNKIILWAYFLMNIIWGHTEYRKIPKPAREGTVYFQVSLSFCSKGAVVSLAVFMKKIFIVKKRWKIFVYLPYCLSLLLSVFKMHFTSVPAGKIMDLNFSSLKNTFLSIIARTNTDVRQYLSTSI